MNDIVIVVINIAGFAVFAFIHSLLAKREFKQWVFVKWPQLESYYRIGYTFISILTLGIWYVVFPFPEGTLYSIPYPYNLLFRLVQVAGLAGFIISLKSVNLSKFLGLHQFTVNGDKPEEQDELVTRGLYRWVRHPLYSASMLILLFNPVMSNKLLLINILFGLYFWIGSIYEERNLVKKFGEDYIKYQQNVPRFIPKIHLFKN